MTTKPVVVGVDGSEESLLAAQWAAREATRRSSPLLIVSAPAPMPRVPAYHASPATIAIALRGIAARALDAAITRSEEVAPGLTIMTELLSGPPALAVAEKGSDASVLVVGARGAGGFAAMVLGSVSRYVASHAPCPVVVVREENMAVHREVVVGVRDPRDITGTLAFAFEEAAIRGADLVAVHAWSWFPSSLHRAVAGDAAQLAPSDPDRISAETESTLAAALEEWRGKYPDVRARHDVLRGHPARVLASYCVRADLVVIGRHAHPGAEGPGIGSIQYAVLDHAHGPLAIVPAAALAAGVTPPAGRLTATEPGSAAGELLAA
jgi:nucleotide-binding universal stress UspA family protein